MAKKRKPRNPVAKAVRQLRPKVKASKKIYKRKKAKAAQEETEI